MILLRLAAVVANCAAAVRERVATASDRATSPTVGSVLLVGVTVLLATATGTHLFGLAGGSQTTFATATVEFSTAEDRVTVSWLTDGDADKLVVRVRVGDQRRSVELDDVGDEVVADGDGLTVSAGSVEHLDSPTVSDGDRVSVTVVAVNGGERVVITKRDQRL